MVAQVKVNALEVVVNVLLTTLSDHTRKLRSIQLPKHTPVSSHHLCNCDCDCIQHTNTSQEIDGSLIPRMQDWALIACRKKTKVVFDLDTTTQAEPIIRYHRYQSKAVHYVQP
jgi:hypothetical protein